MYQGGIQFYKLQQGRMKIDNLLQELKFPIFKESELEFLKEYELCSCNQTYCCHLKRLPQEEHCFYGFLILTLLITKEALSTDDPNNLKLR